MKGIKHYIPGALFVSGCIGVVVTAAMAGRDTIKAYKIINKRGSEIELVSKDYKDSIENVGDAVLCTTKREYAFEVTKATWKCYIPTAITLTCTLGLLITSKALDAKKIAALGTAVASAGGLVTRYRNEIREISGEDILREVDKRVAEKEIEHAKPPVVTTSGLLSSECVDLADDGEYIFFDPFTKVKFRSTKLAVLGAKYYLNRNFQLGSEAPLSMFYGFLGLELPEEYSYAGWDVSEMADDGFYWIDIDIVRADEPDPETGKPYYILEYEFLPGDCDENYYPYGNPILTEGSVAG